jgi:hypothetical protein
VALAAAAGSDAAGNPLARDFAFDCYVFAGDANHDRSVNFNDLVVLAQHYNTAGGMTYDQGDFNGDGAVDFGDLVMLAQRYNLTLPAGADVPVAGEPVAEEPVVSFGEAWAAAAAATDEAAAVVDEDAAAVVEATPKPVFSVTRVSKPVAVKPAARPG